MAQTKWTAGQQPISSYTILRCIGKGAFWEVWEATGPGGLPIALKRMTLAKNEQRNADEMAAIDLAQDVRNPQLLKIHGNWIIDDVLIIGFTLADVGLPQPNKETTQPTSEHVPATEPMPPFTDASDSLDYFCRSSVKSLGTTPAPTPSKAPSSVHAKLTRIRRPSPNWMNGLYASDSAHVNIPFIVGVMGDFVGHSPSKSIPLADRKFIEIDRDNIHDVMCTFGPELRLQVVNKLAKGDDLLPVHLRFQSMRDFEPASVAMQVEPLRKLLEKRAKYSELVSIAAAFGPGEDRSESLPTEHVSILWLELFPNGTPRHEDLQARLSEEIAYIDADLSAQVAAIMHTAEFQKLEGSWRGLQYLVMNTETGTFLKVKVLNITKRELLEDLKLGGNPSQSLVFKMIYTNNFEFVGGQPFGAIIGDYEFQNHPDDIALLRNVSFVAAASFCPFIASVGYAMFGFDSWAELNNPRDLAKIFDTPSYASWKSFRGSEDSRFVVLTMPRSLARLPYGFNTAPINEFGFEEVPLAEDGTPIAVSNEDHCWMSTAYVMGARLTDAFAKYGWCTQIRGFEGGGKVENLPTHVVRTEDGDLGIKCPTEVLISDRREKEISDAGFLPLCNLWNTDYAVFFGGQSTQKPKRYEGLGGDDATANAAIVARLPYILATSRIAHFIKVIAREKFGFMKRDEREQFLNNWVMNFVTTSTEPFAEEKNTHPLAFARIELEDVPGRPGENYAFAYLRPWLNFEELTYPCRLVTILPSAK